MSFRIDLTTKDNVHIFLVVVRNQINLNFSPGIAASDLAPYRLRKNFANLLSHYKLETQEDSVRGEDPEHIKRHHGYDGEVRIPHQHIGFDRDVTPDMLRKFFEGILEGQEYHKGEEDYQFVDEDTVKTVLKNFSLFYDEFVDSSVQKQFLEERRLSKAEKESLARHAAKEYGVLSRSDRRELEVCGIDVKKIKPSVTRDSASEAPSINSLGQLLLLLRHLELSNLRRVAGQLITSLIPRIVVLSPQILMLPAPRAIMALEIVDNRHSKINIKALTEEIYPLKTKLGINVREYVAAAPGAPGDDPGRGGSSICFDGDDSALSRKKIVREGNIRFFRDVVSPRKDVDTRPVDLISRAPHAKEVIRRGNVHFFRDVTSMKDTPRSTLHLTLI